MITALGYTDDLKSLFTNLETSRVADGIDSLNNTIQLNGLIGVIQGQELLQQQQEMANIMKRKEEVDYWQYQVSLLNELDREKVQNLNSQTTFSIASKIAKMQLSSGTVEVPWQWMHPLKRAEVINSLERYWTTNADPFYYLTFAGKLNSDERKRLWNRTAIPLKKDVKYILKKRRKKFEFEDFHAYSLFVNFSDGYWEKQDLISEWDYYVKKRAKKLAKEP